MVTPLKKSMPSNNGVNWWKLNKALHRDIGYFLVGMSLIYGLSGVALNHIEDWDPNYTITHYSMITAHIVQKGEVNSAWVDDFVASVDPGLKVKSHYFPSEGYLKVFVHTGSLLLNMQTGHCQVG